MLKRLLSFVSVMMALTFVAHAADENVIGTYFVNADFSSSDGWTKVLSEQFINAEMGKIGSLSVNNVQSNTDATHTADMYCAGISARWNTNYAAWQQTSKTDLPAGKYLLTFDVSNPGNSSNYNMASLTYVEVGGEKIYDEGFTAAKLVNATGWVAHSIEFTVNAAGPVTISFGYRNDDNVGPGGTPEIFISNLALADALVAYRTAYEDALTRAKAQLATYDEGTEWHTALSTAITTAEGIDRTSADALTQATSDLSKAMTNAAYAEATKDYMQFADGRYFLKNIATGKYLGAANSWGTQASLTAHPSYVTLTCMSNGKYTIKSQVSNGGADQYFNGTYMDGGATELELMKSNGNTAIAWTNDGVTSYIAAPESGSVVEAVGNMSSSAAQWQVISYDEMVASLATASETNPVDATFFINSPEFGRNNVNNGSWKITNADGPKTSGSVGGGNANFLMEAWKKSFNVSQELSGLPSGLYMLKASAMYRIENAGTSNPLPVVYVKSAGKEYTTPFIERVGAENDMQKVAESMANGLYVTDEVRAAVGDGTLTIGARIENGDYWSIFDNFQLWYLGAFDLQKPVATVSLNANETEATLTFTPQEQVKYTYTIYDEAGNECETINCSSSFKLEYDAAKDTNSDDKCVLKVVVTASLGGLSEAGNPVEVTVKRNFAKEVSEALESLEANFNTKFPDYNPSASGNDPVAAKVYATIEKIKSAEPSWADAATAKSLLKSIDDAVEELSHVLLVHYSYTTGGGTAVFTVTPTTDGSNVVYYVNGDKVNAMLIQEGTFTVAADKFNSQGIANLKVTVEERDAADAEVVIATTTVGITLHKVTPTMAMRVKYAKGGTVANVTVTPVSKNSAVLYFFDDDDEPMGMVESDDNTFTIAPAPGQFDEQGIARFTLVVREYDDNENVLSENSAEVTMVSPNATFFKATPIEQVGDNGAYFYNVEAAAFMTKGNDWGTRASFTYADPGLRMRFKAAGDYFTLEDFGGKNDQAWHQFDCEASGTMWVDGDGRGGHNTWSYDVDEDGAFTIANTAAPGYLAVVPSKNDTRLYVSTADDAQPRWIAVSADAFDEAKDLWLTFAEYKNAAKELDAAKAKIDEIADFLDNNNVYTAEAYKAFTEIYPINDWLAAYDNGTLKVSAVNEAYNMFCPTGWHSSNNVDDLLLSAWTIGGQKCSDYTAPLYINTWSVEGNTDGTNFFVPFFEYWTGDAQSLGANTITATVTGLEPGAEYTVSSWTRVRLKNGASAPAFGISFKAGDGKALDACAGEQTGDRPEFLLAELEATGKADAEGNLTITYEVAADNNVSWLSWKNVKYVKASGTTPDTPDTPDTPTVEETDLTAEMFCRYDGFGKDANVTETGVGEYHIGESSGLPYGHGNVEGSAYADLSQYGVLALTVTEGAPRLLLNRQGMDNSGDFIEINDVKGQEYVVVADGVWYINLEKIVAEAGYAHLNCIKGANWANCTITEAKLIPGSFDATAIKGIAAPIKAAGIYTITGAKVDALQKGINIVIDESGAAKKVYVK